MTFDLNLIGSTIDQKYKVSSCLGSGGMGTVYAAEHLDLHRTVAIKFLHIHMLNDKNSKIRFEREAQTLSQLDNPHLVKIYSMGFYAEQIPYIVSEFIDGTSLSAEIASEGRLQISQAIKIGIQVCEALQHVHSLEMIHRDIKPHNIMLSGKDRDFAKVLDFGLAKVISDSDFNALTLSGELIGTPNYLSPEQCRGEKADKSSDIYQLGCVLYECIAGHPPFTADDPISLLHKHINEQPKLLSSQLDDAALTADVEAVILKAIQKDPSKRYKNMSEFKNALNCIATGSTLQFDRDLLIEETKNPAAKAQGNRKAIVASLFVALFLLVTIVVYQSNSKMHSVPIADPTVSMLEKAESILLTVKSNASKRGIIRDDDPSLVRAINLIIRAISSPRDKAKLLSTELESIYKFADLSTIPSQDKTLKDLGTTLIPVNNTAKILSANNDPQSAAELYLLKGLLLGQKSPYLAAQSYCLSALNFAKAGNTQLSNKALDLCDDFPDLDETIKHSISVKKSLAKMQIENSNGKNKELRKNMLKLETEVATVDKLRQSELLSELAKMYQDEGDFNSAKRLFQKSLKYSLNDDQFYKYALYGLAQMQDRLGESKEALESYKLLHGIALRHTDTSLIEEASNAITRLSSKQEE